MKKYLYSGALALATILTLSACAKPKLDAKLSVNDVVQMSGSNLKLKDNQSLIEVSFKLENTFEDMEKDLKTSAKQFYLKDKDGKKSQQVSLTRVTYLLSLRRIRTSRTLRMILEKLNQTTISLHPSSSKLKTTKPINYTLNLKMKKPRAKLFLPT